MVSTADFVSHTSISLQLVIDEASITQSTKEVVKSTKCHHQDGARYNICKYAFVSIIHVLHTTCIMFILATASSMHREYYYT